MSVKDFFIAPVFWVVVAFLFNALTGIWGINNLKRWQFWSLFVAGLFLAGAAAWQTAKSLQDANTAKQQADAQYNTTNKTLGELKSAVTKLAVAAHVDPNGSLGDIVQGIGERLPKTPSLELYYNPQEHTLVFLNRGTSAISVWSTKYGGDDSIGTADIDKPAIIAANGGTYHIVAEQFENAVRSFAGNKDASGPISYWIFVTMDDGRQRILEYFLKTQLQSGALKVETQYVGVELKNFTRMDLANVSR
jgi:hypothetical protein